MSLPSSTIVPLHSWPMVVGIVSPVRIWGLLKGTFLLDGFSFVH